MGSQSRSASEAKSDHISTLKKAVFLEMVLIVGLLLLCFYLARNINVFVPPNFNSGGRIDINSVPSSYIYDFTDKLFKKMYTWSESGEEDYSENILAYQNYFTPNCRKSLKGEYYDLIEAGEIQKRRRTIANLPGKVFDPAKVEKISSSSWVSTIEYNLTETLNDRVIKDIDVKYWIRVVYFDIDTELNPYGLAIDCYQRDPMILNNNLEIKNDVG